jgi:PAS domain S-box-containing protein
MHAIEVFAEDERSKIASAIAQVLNGTDTIVEADLTTVDGDRIPHEWSGNLLTDVDGDAAGIAGVGRDLTERRERERQFRSLVEHSGDMVSIVDADGRIQYQSPAIESILGYDTQETVGDTIWEYVHPDNHTTIRSTVEELRTGSAQCESVRFRVKHSDGSWRWIGARVVEMLDGPVMTGYIITGRDVTEQEADRQRLELFEILSENIQECQFIVDAAGDTFELVYANEYYKWTVGLTPNREVAGQTPTTLFGEAGGREAISRYRECVEQRDTITYTVELSVPEEGTVYRMALTPVVNHGEVTHIVGAAREVTNGQA